MNPSAPAFSIAARVAGSILAVVYIVGAASAPVVAVIGALALITFGRLLVTPRIEGALDAAALALLSAALVTGALRWGTLDLGEIRGAQTVLGPTVALGPRGVAIAVGVAAAAGVIALAEWEAFPAGGDRLDRALWIGETGLGSLALVSIFWGPEVAGASEGADVGATLAAWTGVTLAVAAVALAVSFVLRRVSARTRASLLLLALAGLVVAIGMIGTLS